MPEMPIIPADCIADVRGQLTPDEQALVCAKIDLLCHLRVSAVVIKAIEETYEAAMRIIAAPLTPDGAAGD